MEDLLCCCDKLICQIEGDDIIIKCRYCKRMILIRTKGIVDQWHSETALLKQIDKHK